MAYDSIYTRINWENEKNTPLGATNLNKMDATLKELDDRIVALSKQDESFATKEEIPEINVATSETVGVVKPDGVTTKIDKDGTIHAVGGGGGGGTGTTDYEDLYNKPYINNVELSGNITLEEIGAQAKGNFAEFDESGNLDVPERVKANTAEFSDGIYSSGGIYEDNQYGGNAVIKTEDELSALTTEGYMPDALLVKALHQSMGGYSFYNNPYVVYEVSTSSPFLLNGEYILSDSDTGYTYVGEYTEVYYSEIIEGDFKRRAGADTVSPFNLAKESIVVNKTDGTTATYTITKNCLLIVQSFEQNETSAFNSTIPTVDENITLIELSKNVVGRGGYHSGVAVYQALVNGSGNVSLTKNRTALYIIL